MKVILTCSCFNMKKKASSAYAMLFPKEVLPEIIKGRDNIAKFAKKVGNDHITAISKLTGRFAYFVELDGDKITKEYNLITGQRIA